MSAGVQIAVVIAVLALCALAGLAPLIRRSGIFGKPDCGCGTCAEKRRKGRHAR